MMSPEPWTDPGLGELVRQAKADLIAHVPKLITDRTEAAKAIGRLRPPVECHTTEPGFNAMRQLLADDGWTEEVRRGCWPAKPLGQEIMVYLDPELEGLVVEYRRPNGEVVTRFDLSGMAAHQKEGNL